MPALKVITPNKQSTMSSSSPLKSQPESPPPNRRKPSQIQERLALVYDSLMLAVILLDLLLIGIDLILMSNFAVLIVDWLSLSIWLDHYRTQIHTPLRVLGGFFTVFLIAELGVRWLIAIIQKHYSRWFFFPFAHWYEVLGCFPQLRALRLLRAVFIGRKLYELGYLKLPRKWLDRARFYYDLVFEEISDRVILTATDQLRQQFSVGQSSPNQSSKRIVAHALAENREHLQTYLATVLKQEVVPKLQKAATGNAGQQLSKHVGESVNDALANTKQLRRYLRLIPIAGSLIENELHEIGQQVGENLTTSLSTRLTQHKITDELVDEIVADIMDIDLNSPELDILIANIVNEGLTAFEQQVKVQQWKHHDYLSR